jgi:2'-5' RNA ligase
MRLFVAIHLPDTAVEHLRRVQSVLRPIVPDAAFTRDVNLHLTLRFLGEVADARLDAVRDAIRAACAGGGGLSLRTTQLVLLPPSGGTRVVGARVAGDSVDQLMLLQAALERGLRAAGLPAEERRYLPHVTLARAVRQPLPPSVVARLAPAAQKLWPGPSFEARNITLIQSEPSPAGSRYRDLTNFDLFG